MGRINIRRKKKHVSWKIQGELRHVFEPSTPPGGGEAKYQITMLIPKSDVNTYNAVVAEMNRALQEGLQKTFGGQMPARTLHAPV